MQRPLKILALTAAVTAALVSASVQAETYVCDSRYVTKIFKRNDDGEAFHTPASKGRYGERPRVDYTTILETDDIIWLYQIMFLEAGAPSDTCNKVCQSDREALHLHQISKKYSSYISLSTTGRAVDKVDNQFNDRHTACTVIP